MAMCTLILAIIVVLESLILPTVNGHGYIIDPVNRASRWRVRPDPHKEYTDNQLSCGGRNVQWGRHKGKCGVCGDEYGIRNPKFEYPGRFAQQPPIVKSYTEGSMINVVVKITANHRGYFTFKVAPLVKQPITQEELDKIMLRLPNGDAEWKLPRGNKPFTIQLQLPEGLTCEHCVLQWWWSTGNNWINDKPETFVNCADIAIRPRGSRPKPRPTQRPIPSKPTRRPTKRPRPTRPEPGSGKCRSHGIYESAAMDEWCRNNCAKGHCPAQLCKCK